MLPAGLLACHSTQKTAQTTAASTETKVEVDFAPPPPPPPPPPKAETAKTQFVSWDKTMIDLGQVKKGEKRQMNYTFTNTSGGDVQIEIVDACDCTTVDFPRGVVPAGESRKLDVTFDSSEKEESETIEVRVIFKNLDERGNPRIELIQYKYELLK